MTTRTKGKGVFSIGSAAVAVVLAAVMNASPVRAGDGFKTLARELSYAAKRAGIQRVAVLPLAPADGSQESDGWRIAEKLTTHVVRTQRVQAVERSLLGRLLNEQKLGLSGALNQSTLRKLGRIFTVDGVITGTFVTNGEELTIQARLINPETGLILMAAEQRATRDWHDATPAEPAGEARAWTPPSRALVASLPGMKTHAVSIPWERAGMDDASAPALPPSEDLTNLRDAVATETCENFSERVDGINRQILELKARYWALQLRNGMSAEHLRHNPGSEISDPTLKRRFYDRVKAWYAEPDVPALTEAEAERFTDLDAKAFGLYRQCGA